MGKKPLKHISQSTHIKLAKLASIFVEWDQFQTYEEALYQLLNDYPQGFPTDGFIDSVLANEENLAVVSWDNKTGNYNCAWRGQREIGKQPILGAGFN